LNEPLDPSARRKVASHTRRAAAAAPVLEHLARLHEALKPMGPEVAPLFAALERSVVEQLGILEAQAVATAEANARMVQLVGQQHAMIAQMREQLALLARQKELLETQRAEAATQAAALAAANVEAVFSVEESNERLARLDAEHTRLRRVHKVLSARAEQLRKEAEALAASNVEATLLLDERERALEEITAAKERLAAQSVELEKKAFMDALTGLFNHRYLEEQLKHEVARAQRFGRSLSLLFVDCDHFKKLNDTHGHRTGDEALRRIATVLQGAVRAADVPIRMEVEPFAARYGGEEFVVLLPETPAEGAKVVAERIRARIRETEFPGGETQPLGRVTVSIGVATLAHGEDAAALVERADRALYAAKTQGRDRIVVA
jgi:diguanylate cyclase (GGDEF)-like protein